MTQDKNTLTMMQLIKNTCFYSKGQPCYPVSGADPYVPFRPYVPFGGLRCAPVLTLCTPPVPSMLSAKQVFMSRRPGSSQSLPVLSREILLSGASCRKNRGTVHRNRQGPQNIRDARRRENPSPPASGSWGGYKILRIYGRRKGFCRSGTAKQPVCRRESRKLV